MADWQQHMTSAQTRVLQDGTRTPDFVSVHIKHDINCPTWDAESWLGAKCTCDPVWLLEQEIEVNRQMIAMHEHAISILSVIVSEAKF